MVKRWKLYIIGILLILAGTIPSRSQQMGVSFSYFLPKNGYFSTPISPFSLRGVGFDLHRFFAIETGATLYRMSGLNIKNLPFESKDPLLGPMFTVLVPLEGVVQFIGQAAEFRIKGGGFGFINLGTKINYGNFDRNIREHEGWDVANSEFDFKNKPGFGYHVGAEVVLYVTPDLGITLGGNYFIGNAKMDLTGEYTGGSDGAALITRTPDYADAKVDFTGLEISLGAVFATR